MQPVLRPRAISLPCCMALTAIAVVFAMCLPAVSQQGGSLADAARQARAQKTSQGDDGNKAQQVVDELMDDQNDNGAPGGFKTYAAADYKVWVPAPYHLEGHDDVGVVLSGPMVGSKHPVVLLGNPVVAAWGNNEDAFQAAASQFARLYAQTASCTRTTLSEHPAYQCSMAAATLLGQRVSGNAIFVKAAGNMYPVFCVTPSDSNARDLLNNSRASFNSKRWARDSLDREEADMKTVWQKCDTVFGSIHFKATAVQQASAPQPKAQPAAAATESVPVVPAKTVPAQTTSTAVAKTAEVHGAPPIPQQSSAIPAGFKVQSFNYCQSPNHCWDASLFVPAEAQLVSSDCNEYIFEMKVKGHSLLLLGGSNNCQSRRPDDPNFVRWQQLTALDSERAPGSASTISEQQMNLEGKRAIVTKIKFRKGLTEWIGKRTVVDSNGIPVTVGCMAERDTFGDSEEICSSLTESLRLP